MHEVEEGEIRAAISAFLVILAISVFIFQRVKETAARKAEVRKLQRLAAEDFARAEEEELSSMLAASSALHNQNFYSTSSPSVVIRPSLPPNTTGLQISNPTPSSSSCCAVCATPTKKQCSRCKAVKYCSQQCQLQHWREGHKQECREAERPTLNEIVSPIDALNSNDRIDRSEAAETSPEERASAISKPSPPVDIVNSDKGPSKPGSFSRHSRVLFPYEAFVELFSWDGFKLPPCGLINCGNSCFANVVLQCLTYTRPLAVYLLKGHHMEECQRSNWCFMCELQNHVRRVWDSQIPFSPIHILSRIRNIGNHLGYGQQEDAHEFMRFSIDSMQSICLDSVGGEKGIDQYTQETTLIFHIFGGHLQSQVRCMQCHYESYRYESMMDLAVEINGNVETLQDALAQFTAPEWLDGENKYKCDRCKAYVKAWKRLVIHEAPNILTIALKRFQSGKFGKLNKRVTFPEVLDISPYTSINGDKPPCYYLYGVIVHVDMLNASFFGHYICYVKDFEGLWYKLDDSKVKEVDVDKVMQQRAYTLLYTRCTPRCVMGSGALSRQSVDRPGLDSSHDNQMALFNGHHVPDSLVFSHEANGNGRYHFPQGSGAASSNGNSDLA